MLTFQQAFNVAKKLKESAEAKIKLQEEEATNHKEIVNDVAKEYRKLINDMFVEQFNEWYPEYLADQETVPHDIVLDFKQDAVGCKLFVCTEEDLEYVKSEMHCELLMSVNEELYTRSIEIQNLDYNINYIYNSGSVPYYKFHFCATINSLTDAVSQ